MAAQEAARTAGNAEIAPEHLVLSLLADPKSLATKALTDQGVRVASARKAVSSALPAPSPSMPALIPYDARARKALELTFREALRLGHNYIGTEHILLALLELDGGVPALRELGIEKTACENAILTALRNIAGDD